MVIVAQAGCMSKVRIMDILLTRPVLYHPSIYLFFNLNLGIKKTQSSIAYNNQVRHLKKSKYIVKETNKCAGHSKCDLFVKVILGYTVDSISKYDTLLTLNTCLTSGGTELFQSLSIRMGSNS